MKNDIDKIAFKLLSEKVFLELVKGTITSTTANQKGTFSSELIAHLACELTKEYIQRRDAMLDFNPDE